LFNRSGIILTGSVLYTCPLYSMVACLIVKFPFDYKIRGISFQNYFSRLPMTDSLADWAAITLNPSKDG
jgi:hypothetical protein